ncbi:MAG: hypothetical protein R2715_01885 [Ilumatobacteraceae bacterium]
MHDDDTERTLRRVWPPFGLSLRANGVELRLVRDHDIPALGEVIFGLYPNPENEHFTPLLTMGARAEDVEATTRNAARYFWSNRSSMTPRSGRCRWRWFATG